MATQKIFRRKLDSDYKYTVNDLGIGCNYLRNEHHSLPSHNFTCSITFQ